MNDKNETLTAYTTVIAALSANIVVTRVALGAIAWASWGWQWGVGTVLACWLGTKLATSAIKAYFLEEIQNRRKNAN